MKNRSLLLAVVGLVLMSLLAACGGAKKSDENNTGTKSPAAQAGDGSLERVKKAGKLVVAIDATYPPMEYVDEKDGKTFVGFDVDFAKALAKQLGVEAEFKNIGWDGIIPGLKAKQYDVIVSSMNITDDRKSEVNFVQYVAMSQVFVSAKNGTAVKTEKDLAGKTVAVQDGTTSHDYMKDVVANKVKDAKIITFPNATDAFLALKSKQADVIVVDEPVGLYYASKDAATYAVTGRAMDPEPVGIAIRKEDKELMDALEKAVQAVKSDGTFGKINQTWFGNVELGK
jgi:polar amino acid transport system substrate-binding protein